VRGSRPVVNWKNELVTLCLRERQVKGNKRETKCQQVGGWLLKSDLWNKNFFVATKLFAHLENFRLITKYFEIACHSFSHFSIHALW